jgi:hypothetical protein
MRLTEEEKAMQSGHLGPMRQWAIEHQIKVGQYFGARDFVPVVQAHIMADTESLGVAGVEWLEHWARLPSEQRLVRAHPALRLSSGRAPPGDAARPRFRDAA